MMRCVKINILQGHYPAPRWKFPASTKALNQALLNFQSKNKKHYEKIINKHQQNHHAVEYESNIKCV